MLSESLGLLEYIYKNDLPAISLPEYLVRNVEVSVSVYEAPDDDGFILTWNDGVANEWAEWFPTMSILLLRLALLVNFGEGGWDNGFISEPNEFVTHAKRFFFTQGVEK